MIVAPIIVQAGIARVRLACSECGRDAFPRHLWCHAEVVGQEPPELSFRCTSCTGDKEDRPRADEVLGALLERGPRGKPVNGRLRAEAAALSRPRPEMPDSLGIRRAVLPPALRVLGQLSLECDEPGA